MNTKLILAVLCYLFINLKVLSQTQNIHRGKAIEQSLTNDEFDVELHRIHDYNTSSRNKGFQFHELAKSNYRQGNLDNAVKAIREAITIRSTGASNELLGKSLYNLSLYYKDLDKNLEAIKTLNRLIALNIGDRLINKAFSLLIILHNRLGDYQKSITYFEKSSSYFLKENRLGDLFKNYLRISEAYVTMEHQNSKNIFHSLNQADSLSTLIKTSLKDRYLISLRKANLYQDLDSFVQAKKYYELALLNSIERKDSNAIALLYNNMAYLHLQDSLMDKGVSFIEKGLPFAFKNPKRKASLYINWAYYYLHKKEFEKAEYYYSRAIKLIAFPDEPFRNVSKKNIEWTSNKLKLLEFLLLRSNFWMEKYKTLPSSIFLEKSLSDFELADLLLDVISRNTHEEYSKLFWREKAAELYSRAVEVCYLLDRGETAYYFFEKNRALLLLEHINDLESKEIAQLPDHLIAREYNYRKQIFSTTHEDTLLELKNKYTQFKDSLKRSFPRYSQLSKSLPVLNYNLHKKTFLKDGAVSLQYIISKDKAFGLFSSNNNSLLFEIENTESLETQAQEYISLLHKPQLTDEAVQQFSECAYALFQNLIPQKILPEIQGKKLFIAPDGFLQHIPFESLVVDKSSAPKYLITQNDISYMYSFSFTQFNKQRYRASNKPFLGIAPVTYAETTLSKLHNAASEVTRINNYFKGDVLLKDEATKKQFLSQKHLYRVLHLATHSGHTTAEEPWLAFADKKVYLNELYGTNHQADLVVLSACKTAQGTIQEGEGVMSMARGFFFSGTNTVVSSLWNVNDKVAQNIMVTFYDYLAQGEKKSVALHKAKKDYLQTATGSLMSPYYWSSFILIGNNDALQQDIIPTNNLFTATPFLFVIISLAGMSLVVFLKTRMNKK